MSACGGTVYYLNRATSEYQLSRPPSDTGDTGPIPGQRQVYANWTRLMRAMAVTVPHHVRQSAKARARIKRVVR